MNVNAVEKPYHEICLNSSQLIVPRDTYQRGLIPARVAQIANAFDERIANEPKISFRNGRYYVMDGQNTIAARKFLNGGNDLQIRCKVYFGMTEREEALLFCTADWLFASADPRPETPRPDFCRGACCRCIPAGHRAGRCSSFV